MPAPPIHRDTDGRPDFMVVLGVAPPYAAEDVKQAYFAKAKELHPDHGGSSRDFDALQKAFEQAQVYLEFRANSRGWIAKHMDGYLHSRQLMDQLEKFGARIETNMIDWLERSFGDFAELTESITTIRLENSKHAEPMIDIMIANRSALELLTRIELPGCQLFDESALKLATFQQLRHLNLSKTQITSAALELVDQLPALKSFDVTGSNVGWWARRKLASRMAQRVEEIPPLLK